MDLLVPVYLFAFSSTITPGPNNIMIMASGAIAAYSSMNSAMLPQVLFIAIAFLIGFPLCWNLAVFWHCIKTGSKKTAMAKIGFNRVMALLLVISILPIIRELTSNYLGI